MLVTSGSKIRPLVERIIPAVIIHESLLLDYPLWLFDNNNKEGGSLRSIEDKLKETVGYKWANSHHFLQITYGGHLFSFSVYYNTQECPEKFYHWQISIWNETGNMALGSFAIPVAKDKETQKLERKDFDQIIDVCRKYVQGTIKCSGCLKEILITDIAGQYFAGRYCKHCWETKYKAIEARENYE